MPETLGPGFYYMDCMEGMKYFPDKFFDLAIVDPPYGINATTFQNGHGASKDTNPKWGTNYRLRKERQNHGDGKLDWDKSPPPQEYFDELFRVSKNQIIWGGNYFNLPPTRGIIVWDKKQPWPSFSQVELAWTSFDRPAAIYRQGNYMGGKIHPTQKPVELYAWLLSKYATKGDKILDTHVGSASSLIACERAGYEYWGFEIDPLYYKSAQERLEKEKAQINLFDLLEDTNGE